MIGILQILFTIGLVLVVLYFLKGERKERVANNELMFYGLPNSRKTRLFYKLLSNKLVDTVTSFAVNRAEFEHAETIYTIVDFPGSSAFDGELKASLKNGSRILFLIDSSKKCVNKEKHL